MDQHLLQKRDIMFSELQPLLDGTLAKLKEMEVNDGNHLKEVKEIVQIKDGDVTFSGEKLIYRNNMDDEFQNLRKAYLKDLVQ